MPELTHTGQLDVGMPLNVDVPCWIKRQVMPRYFNLYIYELSIRWPLITFLEKRIQEIPSPLQIAIRISEINE